MGRSLFVVSCVLWVGCGEPAPKVVSTPPTAAPSNPSAASVEPAPDWAAELEWARSRFPELATFRPDVDMEPLLSWVPPGKPLGLFITIVDSEEHPYHCAPVTASRAEGSELVELKIYGAERVENGQRLLFEEDALVGVENTGHALAFPGISRDLKQHKDGSWDDPSAYDAEGVSATSPSAWGFSVGPVEGDVLRFRHVAAVLQASCGPIASLPCEGGSTLRCNTCKEVKVTVTRISGGMIHMQFPPPIRNWCAGPCPAVTNPEFDRVTRFVKHFREGFVVDEGPGWVSLYRTLSSCQADKLGTATPAGESK
jgi:hypothetical protein